jgi:hypothetical protein
LVLAYLLIVLTSTATGLALRAIVNPMVGRTLQALGLAALLLAVGPIGLVAVGLIRFWSSSMIALLLFVVVGLVLPFGLAVSLRRS